MRPTSSTNPYLDQSERGWQPGSSMRPVLEGGGPVPDGRPETVPDGKVRRAGAMGSGLHELARRMNVPLLKVDYRSKQVIAQTPAFPLPDPPHEFLNRLRQSSEQTLFDDAAGFTWFNLPGRFSGAGSVVACGCVVAVDGALERFAEQRGWTSAQLARVRSQFPRCDHQVLKTLVDLTSHVQHVALLNRESALSATIDNYDDVLLLASLIEQMELSRPHRELAEMALSMLVRVVPAEQYTIRMLVKDHDEWLTIGSLLDESTLSRLLVRCGDEQGQHPLQRSNLGGTLLGADFPGLRDYCLVPVTHGERTVGWLVCLNRLPASDAGQPGHSSIRLLTSVGKILSVHGANLDQSRGHNDLLLSFVRSLVSSLDAKDPYTRGHSERVAMIARRLGEQIGLPAEDLRDIYLAGLLHDIGKIGVDNEILRKPGKLSAEEYDQIKKHPVIGYNILAGLGNLRSVLPGVRSHHESWDGRGYPDGLAGDAIPLMARILAVADSYDAMGSDRPYRAGMPLETLEEVLKKGSGSQWDPNLVGAYFACKDDVRRMCREYTTSTSAVLRHSVNDLDFLEHGDATTTDGLRGALDCPSSAIAPVA